MASNLRAADLAAFVRLGIPAELLAEAGVCRVSDDEARSEFGIRGAGDMAGVAFLYFDPVSMLNGGRRRWYVRIRRDHPDLEDGKAKRKYICPFGDRKHFFFPPRSAWFGDVAVPIILVEAEKSALALTAWADRTGRKLLPLAMGGCWGWRGQVGIKETATGERVPERGAILDLTICREGRKTFVLLDANCGTNPRVQAARAALVRQLRSQGADVSVLNLPSSGGVNGPDDFIANRGDEAMGKLIDGWQDGDILLRDLIEYYRTYIRVGEDEYLVLAVWVLHCHAFAAFTRTPYLHVTSPTLECGKTQCLATTELVVPRPMNASSCTAAVLSRTIEIEQPVLMIDEFDQLIAGDKELLAAVLQTINSGYKKGGRRYILEPTKGGGWQPKALSTFCPKILCGISSLPATTRSRCIPIQMERLAPGDRVSDPDEYTIEPQAADLKKRAVAWAAQHLKELTHARPATPPALRNRQREVARPLFAVADAIGGAWPERVRSAVVSLFGARDAAPSEDVKEGLLADIREAFREGERIASADLVQSLTKMEDRPWATWGKSGKGINQNQLARQLRDFKIYPIYPKTVRLDDGRRLKGYERAQFQRVWDLYLRHHDVETVTPYNPLTSKELDQDSNRDTEMTVTDGKPSEPKSMLACHAVTDEKRERSDGSDIGPVSRSGVASPVPPRCYLHPSNIDNWWLRDQDHVCGICHPNPAID
jgi:hypothetical protein